MRRLIESNILLTSIIASCSIYAFDSGSSGADGVFNPTTDIEVQLPPSGIFNYTSVSIPDGVTVTYAKNAANTPVVILASEDITIDGVINISGGVSGDTTDADTSDDALPGPGGPGGFDGGRGGYIGSGTNNDGAHGQGPGGGGPGTRENSNTQFPTSCGGGGGGFGFAGGSSLTIAFCRDTGGAGGATYGSETLLPLIGGSGGAGGAGNSTISTFGSAGGGGGGALLLASSETITINGAIVSNGGNAGSATIPSNTGRCAGGGGGGSGGAIRIIATTISGSGAVTAFGGVPDRTATTQNCWGFFGGRGRIRLEAENMQFTTLTSPPFSFAAPSPVFVPNIPSINIASIAGITAPAAPTGTNDIVLPENTPNPVSVNFTTSDIPAGGTILLTATPINGSTATATSTPIASDGTATASISLPNGPSTLIASTTFTVTAALSKDFSRYAKGEPVEKVRVGINAEGKSETTFITESGKAFTWPSNAVAMH